MVTRTSLVFATLIINMALLTACGVMPASEPGLILGDHSLTGKIWDVKAARFIDKDQLLLEAVQSDYVLLGETHDNPLHHQHQAWVINGLRVNKQSAIVAFEMIDQAQGKFIAGKQHDSADSLINALNHVKTTWKYERFYKPVFESVIRASYPIYPANLDRSVILDVARKGEEKIPNHIKPYLEKNKFTAQQEKTLREEIKASHCGMENPQMETAMMLTQRAKDAVMTDSLLNKGNIDVRVLVAGSGHVRNDRGVPMYLQREDNKAKITAIAWLEVIEDQDAINAYAEHWSDKGLPFDYVWFTARIDRPDPCESFRRHMKKKAEKL